MRNKLASRLFFDSLRAFDYEQKTAVHQMANRIVKDPDDFERREPIIILSSDDREVEVAGDQRGIPGVWLRYRLDAKTKTVIFLKVSPLVE